MLMRKPAFIRQRRWKAPRAVRLVFGLVGLVAVGTLLLMLPDMSTGAPLATNQALFTAASALSVTGLSVITPSTHLTFQGQIVLLALIQLGGFGFMAMAVIVFRLIGRQVSLLDRLALRDSLDLMVPTAILKLTQRVIFIVLFIESIGAFFLWLHWRGALGDERAVFYAIFHAVSAFCNAGFNLFDGLPDHPYGLPTDSVSMLIMSALIILGGLGIPLLANLSTEIGAFIAQRRKIRLNLHTRVMLIVSVFLIIGGAVGIYISEVRPGGLLQELHWTRSVELALFQSISSRTAGFAAFAQFDQLLPATEATIMALMFIGSAPASMGGGITTGTFAVLLIALWNYAQGRSVAVVGDRTIPAALVRKAIAVLLVSLTVVIVATWIILYSHPVTLDMALFEVVSAFATCGLSLAFTSELDLTGQIAIVIVMLWGRLGALTIVATLAYVRPEPRTSYPEEQILIG